MTIPFERMRDAHFLHDQNRDNDLAGAVAALGKLRFAKAPFWEGNPPATWRLSRIMKHVNQVDQWVDQHDVHPCSKHAANIVEAKPVTEILRILRNALAHGNIIYLNKNGREVPGERMEFIAFLSRYEETEAQRNVMETYRVLIIPEMDFLTFVKQWAGWIVAIPRDQQIVEVAPATAA